MKYGATEKVHAPCDYKWEGCEKAPRSSRASKGSHVCEMIVDVAKADKGDYAKRTAACKRHKCTHCNERG